MKKIFALVFTGILLSVLAFGISCKRPPVQSEQSQPISTELFIVEDGFLMGLTALGKQQKDVVIPTEVNGQKITNIWQGSFEDNLMISSLTVSEGVVAIDNFAFSGCINLKSVILPDSITIIGDEAFSNCTLLEKVTIGKSIEIIDENAFLECPSLSEVVFNGTVTAWKNIDCSHDWTYNLSLNKITCSNGDIEIQHEGDSPTMPKK